MTAPDVPELLPLVGSTSATTGGDAATAAGAACHVDDDGCITCGDVALELTVVEAGEFDARCRDADGNEEVVATELVPPLAVGDRVLVHAKVALERLERQEGTHEVR